MELKEFIIDVYIKHNIEWNDEVVEDMITKITDYASKIRKDETCVAISDSDIEKFVLDNKTMVEDLERRKKEEAENKKKEQEALRIKKEEEANKKAIEERKPYQMGLF